MMQYGNEPGGYMPQGNFIPPGGGPPPPLNNPPIASFPPMSRNPQNITSPPPGGMVQQQKNSQPVQFPGLQTSLNAIQNGPSQLPKSHEKQPPPTQQPYGGYYKPMQQVGNQVQSINANQHPGQYQQPPAPVAQLSNQMQGMNIGPPPTQQYPPGMANGPPGQQYGRNQMPPLSTGQPTAAPSPLTPPSHVNGQHSAAPQPNGSPPAPLPQTSGFHQSGQVSCEF